MKITEYIIAAALLIIIDIPWLTYQMSVNGGMFDAIQGGRPMKVRLWPAAVVYAALALLLVNMKSMKEAAIAGAATYAVYDFTNLVTFKDYKVEFAVMDTLWGGTLFAMAYFVLKKIKGSGFF
jgi:uncharacterized membrane protein